MRSVQRNHRIIWYANPTGETEPILDEYGNDTLEVRTIYHEPKKIKCNVGASGGKDVVEIFGSVTEYNRTISFAGVCPLVEDSKVWFEKDPTLPHNYVVVRVADAKNDVLVALREVIAK